MHSIDLFVYFPILDLDQKIPNYLNQVFDFSDEQNKRNKVFDITHWEIITITIEIVFFIVLCIAIYCLKRNQNSVEQRLIEMIVILKLKSKMK